MRILPALASAVVCSGPTLLAGLALAATPQAPAATGSVPDLALERSGLEPEVHVEVLRVIDGDTLEVELDGAPTTLRLLSVDTEEKITGRVSDSTTKPETVFGEQTAQWARAFFAELGRPARVGLAFPEGRRLDAFGRLLAHVLLPDGRDFNLLLVAEGRSPYFDKYGHSLVAHAAFVRAQAAARAAELGIWNPATNRAKTPGAPSVLRPYERLLPWWEARAQAIDGFRALAGRGEDAPVSAEDAAALRRAFERCRAAPEQRITVFTTVERFFDEADGSLTALLYPGGPESALRAAIPAAERAALEPLLRASTEEFRQNYLWVTGRIERNARGFVLTGATRTDWRTAEPEFPARASAPR